MGPPKRAPQGRPTLQMRPVIFSQMTRLSPRPKWQIRDSTVPFDSRFWSFHSTLLLLHKKAPAIWPSSELFPPPLSHGTSLSLYFTIHSLVHSVNFPNSTLWKAWRRARVVLVLGESEVTSFPYKQKPSRSLSLLGLPSCLDSCLHTPWCVTALTRSPRSLCHPCPNTQPLAKFCHQSKFFISNFSSENDHCFLLCLNLRFSNGGWALCQPGHIHPPASVTLGTTVLRIRHMSSLLCIDTSGEFFLSLLSKAPLSSSPHPSFLKSTDNLAPLPSFMRIEPHGSLPACPHQFSQHSRRCQPR